MRKKTAMSLDARYTMMIENAFYVVNPPEAPSIPRERLPPMHEYIQRLLYHDLSKTTTEKVKDVYTCTCAWPSAPAHQQ